MLMRQPRHVLRQPRDLLAGISRWPLWSCGHRPFFLAASLAAIGLMLAWMAHLGAGLPLPAVLGGPSVWHGHELLFGLALAAIAGFSLTAVPEFTGSAAIPPRPVIWLSGVWLLGRLAYAASGSASPGQPALLLAGCAHLGVIAGLIWLLAPRLWRQAQRPHLGLLWLLLLLGGCIGGFYVDAWLGRHPGRWLHAALGVVMLLIVFALGRISMSVVNAALAETHPTRPPHYLARPPRRQLVLCCIALYTASEWLAPGGRTAGWLALASAAAIANLLNDWHVGRALLRRWPLLLYVSLIGMAAGYALIGLSLLDLAPRAGSLNAGRHLLTIAALGLTLLGVFCIAGRTHCGAALDRGPWVSVAALLLLAAAGLRATPALFAGTHLPALLAAAACWILAFVLIAVQLGPMFWQARTDAGSGCEGRR